MSEVNIRDNARDSAKTADRLPTPRSAESFDFFEIVNDLGVSASDWLRRFFGAQTGVPGASR